MVVVPRNVPKRISLLAIDVDGTLVTDDNRVLPETQVAVRRAHREGLRVVLATGRRYRTTLHALQQLSLRLPVVCLGGSLTKSTDGETLHSDPFTVGQVGHLLALARNRGQALILQRDADGGAGPDFVADGNAPWNEPTRHYVDVGGDSGSQDARLEDAGHDDILVVGAFGELEGLRALQEDIAHTGEFATTLVESKRTPGWYLETTLGHVNKWAAIRRLAVASRIDPLAVCAVGDAANDLPMIRGAAFGVAMGNAGPGVKEAADWVTSSNERNGVGALVDRLLDAYTPGGSSGHCVH